MVLRVSKDLQLWIDAGKRFHLSHAQVQMARELGMNPKKLGKLANHKQEPWKLPLPQFIEHLYQKRFGKSRPDVVVALEERARRLAAKKRARSEAKRRAEIERPGIAWYLPEQWDKLREISADRDSLGDTYEHWLAKAEKEQAQTTAAGRNVERVIINVEELEAWCRSRGWVLNQKSRSRFVAYLLKQREGESENDGRIGGDAPSQAEGTVPF